MHAHEFFADLLIHDDDELAAALGAPIVERELRHEWPLSRLEEIRLDDGRHVAYKAQLPPTVEPEFYAAASSPVLVPHQDLGKSGRTRFMVTEWIEAPALGSLDLDLDTDAFIEHAGAVIRLTGAIGGNPPVFLDLASGPALQVIADETATRLAALIGDGRFPNLPRDVPGLIEDWARSSDVVDAVSAAPGIAHSDLSPDEVLVVGDGYRVIDWQRPVLGPPEIDLVTLLRHRGLDPAGYVERPYVQVSWFLLLHWAALAQHDLLPGLPSQFTEGWARDALAGMFGDDSEAGGSSVEEEPPASLISAED